MVVAVALGGVGARGSLGRGPRSSGYASRSCPEGLHIGMSMGTCDADWGFAMDVGRSYTYERAI